MIEIVNLNKYFNKGKKNEIHVINNTSLSLPDNGLVALLGPSGCGKTTLLNAIGGLDKVRSGSIYINGEKITSKFAYKVDKIRNLSVGYIFQDYKLIDNLSVFDNVAIVLKMLGIKDKNEIKKRVEYVLDKVGMLRYKKRPAEMLSGGERQRVGIARAIVKDPDIILADEPTGNLDSKNTLEIMNIIKAISRDKLVILVTHEQQLAKFYASRIIEMQDGKIINDYENIHSDKLDYAIDNVIYLKDFKNHDNLNKDNMNIEVYSNDDAKINISIIIKNGNIYIKSNIDKKVEVIDENSNIEIINDSYKKIDKDDVDNYEFEYKNVFDSNINKKYSSILNIFTTISTGFKKVFSFTILKKILLVGFFLAGIFVTYSLSSLFAVTTVKDEMFVKYNNNYLIIDIDMIDVNEYLEYEKSDNIEYIIPGDSHVNFTLPYNNLYQTYNQTDTLTGSLTTLKAINENDLIYGKMPENEYEIVVDKMAIEAMFRGNNARMAGFLDIRDILNKKVYINNMKEFEIVGITDLKSPSIYAEELIFINAFYNSDFEKQYLIGNSMILDYNLLKDKIELKEGKYPVNEGEVIVNINNKYEMPLNKTIDIEINGQKLKVVGYYSTNTDIDHYLVNNEVIKKYLVSRSENIMIYPKDKTSALKEFESYDLNVYDSYEYSKNQFNEQRRQVVAATVLASTTVLAVSLIEICLMIRSSFLTRIREIGIYRAIGVKKLDIYKMFIGEIFAITTLASLPGLLFMGYILEILSNIQLFSHTFAMNISIILLAILITYLFNLIIGLLPVYMVLRKTPAEILARHDID